LRQKSERRILSDSRGRHDDADGNPDPAGTDQSNPQLLNSVLGGREQVLEFPDAVL
jgi:hypothetical protein